MNISELYNNLEIYTSIFKEEILFICNKKIEKRDDLGDDAVYIFYNFYDTSDNIHTRTEAQLRKNMLWEVDDTTFYYNKHQTLIKNINSELIKIIRQHKIKNILKDGNILGATQNT